MAERMLHFSALLEMVEHGFHVCFDLFGVPPSEFGVDAHKEVEQGNDVGEPHEVVQALFFCRWRGDELGSVDVNDGEMVMVAPFLV